MSRLLSRRLPRRRPKSRESRPPAVAGADGLPAATRTPALAVAAAVLLVAGVPDTVRAQDTLPESDWQTGEEVESGRYGSFTFLKRPVGDSGSMMSVLLGSEIGSTVESEVRLFFRCLASKPEIYLMATDTTLGPPGGSARGQYRFDRGSWSELEAWPTDETGQAAFLPGRVLGRFVTRALEADRVYVQLAGERGSFRQSVFSLQGFSEGARRLPCFRGALPRIQRTG